MRSHRANSSVDVGRLGAAVRGPGIDTRTWVSLAIVAAVHIDPSEGVFVDVILMPSQRKATARLGAEYAGNDFGLYMPLEVDDEILVETPGGDPDAGLVVTRRLHSPSDRPPSEAATYPNDVLLVAKTGRTVRILLEGDGLCEIRSRGGQARALAFKDELVAVDNKYESHIHQDSTSAPTSGPMQFAIPNPGPPPAFLPGPPLPPVTIVGTTVLKAE